MSKAILLQGNEACVMGAIKAGMRLFAGYPITPSSEIAEQSSILLPKVGGKFLLDLVLVARIGMGNVPLGFFGHDTCSLNYIRPSSASARAEASLLLPARLPRSVKP